METTDLDNAVVFEDEPRPAAASWRRGRKASHIWSGVLLLVGIASVFLLAPFASNPQTLKWVRDALDEQQGAVGAMAAGATGLSAALSIVPGDALTPIADQLAGLSGWFIVIVGAIILQKLLLTTSGFIAFTFIVPLACVLGIAFAYSGRTALRMMALKIATFGVVLFLAVPGSIAVSGMLTILHTDLSRVQTEVSATLAPTPKTEKPKAEEPKDLFGRIQQWFSDVGTSVGDTVSNAVAAADQFRQDAVDQFNLYLEKIALFIITTCVMPILVFLLFGWVIKLLFNVDIGAGRMTRTMQASASHGSRLLNRGAQRLSARFLEEDGDD